MLLKVAAGLGTRLSEGAVCNILAQVADALDYVHRATDESGKPLHIVHRDVSPSNIQVTASGVVKLMDFGLAMHDADWREQTRSSWSGFKGKPMYLSPEQVNRQPLDGRADLFALGCILVECLTGRRLFGGDQEALILHAIQNVTPEEVEKALQGVPEGLKAICHKLLAPDREEGYGTGREVAEALRSWAFGEKRYSLDSRTLAQEVAELMGLEDEENTPPPLDQPPSSQGERSSTRSRPPRVAVTALALVALVLVAISLWRPPPQPRNRIRWCRRTRMQPYGISGRAQPSRFLSPLHRTESPDRPVTRAQAVVRRRRYGSLPQPRAAWAACRPGIRRLRLS
jgi:serine/threonine protein kinase